ncbi:hypothetical protein ZWY2020_046766 [Hordeum vulgare]|nr:hypothetical protein ZWY2020_046766 [Hordeum vulgare]
MFSGVVFAFENQLPWVVVEMLMESRAAPDLTGLVGRVKGSLEPGRRRKPPAWNGSYRSISSASAALHRRTGTKRFVRKWPYVPPRLVRKAKASISTP